MKKEEKKVSITVKELIIKLLDMNMEDIVIIRDAKGQEIHPAQICIKTPKKLGALFG